jgi:hypothetical protein
MTKTEILFCVGESERTGGLTFYDVFWSRARRLQEEKNGLEVCVRMGGAVDYSHEKQKMTAVSLRLIFISVPRESAECVPRT